MPTSGHIVTGGGFSRCSGFALLLVLGLLGLIASVLAGVSLLLVQENALQRQAEQLRQARLNAQFGLMEALGQLQQYAGKDAVVTARAGMLGSDPDNGVARAVPEAMAWTGLWPVVNGSAVARPLWLVSGGNAEPTRSLPAEESVAVVAERSALGGFGAAAPEWAAVRVPLVSLPHTGGAYGWWVGDEGVKVNIAAADADRGASLTQFGERWPQAEVARLETLLPGPDVDSVLPPAGAGDAHAVARVDDAALRARVFDFSDLGYLAETRPDAAFAYRSDLFHEVTLSSSGVLADPSTGLRADYSLEAERFPLKGEFAQYADYRAAMETPVEPSSSRDLFIPGPDDQRRRYAMRPPSATPAEGTVSAAIAPVLTDCYLLFNVHRAHAEDFTRLAEYDRANRPAHAAEIMIHAGAFVELWNPYTSALVPQDLLLEVEGLPANVQMRVDGSAAVYNVPLRSRLRNGASDSWWIVLPFTDKEHSGKKPTWFPGRVYNWTGPNNYAEGSGSQYDGGQTGNFLNRDLNESIWAQRTGVAYAAAAGTGEKAAAEPRFRIGLPAQTRLTVRLRLKPQSGDWSDAPVLAEFADVAFDRVASSPQLYAANSRQYQFGFRIRLEDPGSLAASGSFAAWEKSRWLRRGDPRAAFHTAIGEQPTAGNGYFLPFGKNPADHVQAAGKGFFGLVDEAELWNRMMGEKGILQVEDAPLFELPRQDLLRVADLRHLHLAGVRPYAVGNRWGADTVAGDVNRVFDLGFFSGLAPQGEASGTLAGGTTGGGSTQTALKSAAGSSGLLVRQRVLPNGRLVFSGDNGADAALPSAQRLMLHGAFNLNTDSVGAWRSVLAGADYADFTFIKTDDGDGSFNAQRLTRTVSLGNAVSRFGQSAGETYDPGDYRASDYAGVYGTRNHDPAVEPPTHYFRQGLVPLSDAQLGVLARSVSRRIRMRADAGLPPFGSFAEFLAPVPLESFRHLRESNTQMSVLEAAVYDAMADESLPSASRLNRDASGNIVWWDTPSFVNGGDLWAQFAHYAAVRSDTFRIRAYGRSASIAGIEAEAWCEAIVQRTAVPYLPAAGGTVGAEVSEGGNIRSPQSPFGRRFKVLSVRWLRVDEL